ncbi:MAG: hypothetical protein IKE94_12325, partial [Aeriscardovia sp.]|nr:hypothetical protein [Aeriscardovia sp.]
MVVDWSYRGENEFVTNLYRITAASTTVENAKNVVAAAASMSDYDKLLYYNDWLCENVSYNHVAADQGYEQYGENNPWEIIYVFDNDPTTKVVCEGYAKSFKYLADLTS